MTVLIYVDTSKQVGDPDHLKVFANATLRQLGLRKTIPKALPRVRGDRAASVNRRALLVITKFSPP